MPSEGKTAGNTKKPHPDDILTSGTVDARKNTGMSNRVEQRVVPDSRLSDSQEVGHAHHAHGGGSQ